MEVLEYFFEIVLDVLLGKLFCLGDFFRQLMLVVVVFLLFFEQLIVNVHHDRLIVGLDVILDDFFLAFWKALITLRFGHQLKQILA